MDWAKVKVIRLVQRGKNTSIKRYMLRDLTNERCKTKTKS